MALNEELPGLVFNPRADYTGCRICGTIFQSALDRNIWNEKNIGNGETDQQLILEAEEIRRLWSKNHASQHSEKEHLLLQKSGRWCTPEAAEKMAAAGVVSVIDLALDNEIKDALAKAPAVLANDVEGT